MSEYETAGIVESVMSALSLLVVGNRPAANQRRGASRRRRLVMWSLASDDPVRKESYFEMARYSRWKQ